MKDIWNDCGVHQVAEIARTDKHYQDLLAECRRLEAGFCAVMDRLSEAERRLVEEYVAICEDLQYRETQLAYILGSTRPK